MTTRKLTIELDEDLIRRARARTGNRGGSDDAVIANAVEAFVGLAALDDAHSRGGLAPDEADALAVEEVRAHRASRGHAA